MLIVLSFDKSEAYAKKNCILPLTLGGSVPIGLGLPVGIATSASSSAPFLPSIHISRISPRPTEPSRTSLPSSPTQLVIRTRTFLFPAAVIPQTRLTQYSIAQLGAMCGPHCAEYIYLRRRRWTGLGPVFVTYSLTPAPLPRSHRLRSSSLHGERPLPMRDRAKVERGSVEQQYRRWKRSVRE
jgi:hypothetical protein